MTPESKPERPDGADSGQDSAQERMVKARPTGDERLYTGEPIETKEGDIEAPAQHNQGRQGSAGSGEFPDPATPPSEPTALEPNPEEESPDDA